MNKWKLSLHLFISFMRIAGMGGKFVFTLAATNSLSADEFGRFGLIAAGVWLGVMVVGLEVSTVVLRDVVVNEPSETRKLRGLFLTYAWVAGFVAASIAWLLSIWAGFGTTVAALVAVVMFLEYFCQELTRLLVVSSYLVRSSIAIFCRGGLWCYVLVGGTILGIAPAKWSLPMVLVCWILSDLVVIVLATVLRTSIDWTPRVFLELVPMIRSLATRALPFLVSAIGFQVLLSGGRFAIAYFDSEAVSGRFTLLSTIASVNLTLVKGICEQIYFAKIVGKDRLKYWGEFTRSVYSIMAISTLASLGAVPVYMKLFGKTLTAIELQSLGWLLVGYSALCLTVISRFRLYAAGRDHALMICSSISVAAFLVSALILTPTFGLIGASIATMIGAVALPVGQSWAGRRLAAEDAETNASGNIGAGLEGDSDVRPDLPEAAETAPVLLTRPSISS